MIRFIYIEKEVAEHPRVKAICRCFPRATLIPCARYGEVFNRKAQNFRLQKRNPALILARKFGRFVLETPAGYGIGGRHNFYFSHMLNCIYDCRYCFLQGMYESAHYVVFINYEEFQSAIEEAILGCAQEECYFFSGYDCDSLALESVTHFAESFLPLFARHPTAWLELRTKSTQIRVLMDTPPIQNCIVAYSLTPPEIGEALEHKTPPLEKRLEALVQLAQRGWKLGLRFDPLIHHPEYAEQYRMLFANIFRKIGVQSLHSVSLGPFRLPKRTYENIYRLYPDEKLFALPLKERHGIVSYDRELEEEMIESCTRELLRYIPASIFFPCGQAGCKAQKSSQPAAG